MDVTLLGQSFLISTDEDDQYLSTLIEHYRTLIEKVKRSTSTPNNQIIAMLAGLLAVDEYYTLQRKSDPSASVAPHPHAHSDTKEAQEITDSILSKIDEII